MRRVLFEPAVVALVAVLLLSTAPVAQAQNDDLNLVGKHTIIVQKGDRNGTTSVSETLRFANEGTSNFTGTISVDLDPDATVEVYYFTDGTGSPLPNGGQAERDPVPSAPSGDHQRFTFDLAANGVAFPPGATSALRFLYTLPGDDTTFTRGFSRDTPLVSLEVRAPAGMRPESDTVTFDAVVPWVFDLSADDNGPYTAGSAIAFEWVDNPVPMTPLGVSVSGTAVDGSLRLSADVSGGIPPYTVTWDLDQDGDCDDAEGETTTMDVSEPGAHTATACVADSAQPGGSIDQSYETRTTQAAPTTTSPAAWMMGLIGLLVGALVLYGLVQGGMIGGKGRTSGTTQSRSSGPSFGAESRDMLELRQRVMVASLKELEIAKKKGEVPEGLYTPLKAELKQDTVRVMRELEKRKTETV